MWEGLGFMNIRWESRGESIKGVGYIERDFNWPDICSVAIWAQAEPASQEISNLCIWGIRSQCQVGMSDLWMCVPVYGCVCLCYAYM